MIPLPLNWLSEVLGNPQSGTVQGDFIGISTDTRQTVAGTVFLALQGENTNGHRYLSTAVEKGAVGVVVTQWQEGVSLPQWVVEDTLTALGVVARAYRERFEIPIIGITGSVGKTSTKEMIGAMVSAFVPTLISAKNYNNEIGVPQTLLQLAPEHRVGVLEMGMRGAGQIAYLAQVARPTIGVITQIGVAHIELLGSQEGIAEAKSELYTELPKGGSAILPLTSPYSDLLAERVPQGVGIVRYGVTESEEAEVRAVPASVHLNDSGKPSFQAVVQGKTYSLSLNAVGAHQVHNATAALAVALVLGLDIPKAILAIESWEGAEGRMVVRESPRGYRILDDCYNAAPESMRASLITLDRLVPGGVAILGDMRELGDYSQEAHRQVGQAVSESGVRLLVTVGALAQEIAEEVRRTGKHLPAFAHYPNSKACSEQIAVHLNTGDTVLVKGSRAMEMEQIVAVLMEQGSKDV